MYETSYRGIRYCFQEDCLVLNGNVIDYKEMNNIRHRGGDVPAFIFEYRGKKFAMPYPPGELQEILPYMKKASKITPPLSPSEPVPVEEMSASSESDVIGPPDAEIIPERTTFKTPPVAVGTANKKSKRKGCLVGVGIIILLLILLFACIGGGEESDKSTDTDTTIEMEEDNTEPTTEMEENSTEPATEAETETEPETDSLAELSGEERNAYEQGLNYLDYTSFSRSGLINQLKYEGYPEEACEKAVSQIEEDGKVDWTEQCEKKAKEYLDFTEFSKSGLIDQLKYEGFTDDQINSIIDKVYQ